MSVGGMTEDKGSIVRVVALCKTPDALRPSITFLARRGIQINVATTLQDALEKISNDQPDYVFISINFQHPKIDSIPGVLDQSLGIETVLFAEKWDRRLEARASQVKVKHVITGTISGPAILLKIRAILKEQHAKKVKAARPNRNLWDELGLSKDEQSNIGAQDIIPSAEGESVSPQAAPAAKSKIAFHRFAKVVEKEETAKTLIFKQDPRVKSSPFLPKADLRNQPNHIIIPSDPAKVLPFPSTHYGAPLKKVPDNVAHNPKALLIWECARRAVMDAAACTEVYDVAIAKIHSLALLSINSSSVNGCFLLTAGKGRDLSYGALGQLEERFLFYLREAGQHIEESDCDIIELDASTLPDGAFIDSDFAITAISNTAELSISFLDIQHTKPEVQPSAIEDFSKVQVRDIATGVPLTFDAYIYMPLNQKTIKYLKQGGMLGLRQKEKLIEDGTEHLYIREYAIGSFKEYHARATLHGEFDKRRSANSDPKKKAA